MEPKIRTTNMKKVFLLIALLTACLLPNMAADNLLSNGDFEEAQSNFLFGAEFTDWTFGAGVAIETTDIYHGKQALRTTEVKQTRSLNQSISLQSDVTGQEFELTIHYKVLSANAGDLFLNSAWEFRYAQEGTPHDSLVLNQVLPIGEGWQELKVKTTKPQDATGFLFSVGVKKGVLVIFDDFSFARTENQNPWYTVMPEYIAPARSNIGDEVLMTTLTIRQGNITTPIQLYISGANKDMFRLEKTEVTQPEETVRLWYAPTAVGNHKAMLITDCSQALGNNRTFVLSGVASDSTLKPEIHINPATLPQFTAKVGTQVRDSVVVTTLNCTEDLSVSCLNDGDGNAFSVNTTLLPRNMEVKTFITFSPRKAGTYTATVYWSTKGAQKQQMRLTGVATEGDPEQQDWATAFTWDMSSPVTLLNEHFDNINHNKTLKLNGWQNVVLQGARPWWGFEDKNNDSEHCAKATAYIWGATDSAMYEMWLVTPALDYKNAKNQVFTFRVRGDNLYQGQSAKLQLHFIDATDANDIFFQDLEIEMPATSDQAGDWLDFQVNLTGQEYIPDVFYMAFRFTGYSGSNGAATYLIDDVSWGREDLPLITADSVHIIATALPNEIKAFPVMVMGENLTEDISITIAGSNRSKFKVEPATLPKEGGALAVGFQSDQEGVHEAYLRIRSRGAVDVYIPIMILVKQGADIQDITAPSASPCRIVLHHGTIRILTPTGTYSLTGQRLAP